MCEQVSIYILISMDKLLSYDTIETDIKKIKAQGKLVLVGGCFDILHIGHIEFLDRAKKQGDTLLVMLESDTSVRKRKGENRPINSQKKRARVLSTLRTVNYILPLPYLKTDLEYYDLVKKLEPDIIAVTENDTAYNKKVEQAKQVSGRVVEVIKRLPHSTTKILEQI